MLLFIISIIIIIAFYFLFIFKTIKKEIKELIIYSNEDDAFATILSQIFKSKNESELHNTVKYIVAYDEQFNNQTDIEYFIHIWDKRMQFLKPNK